MLFNNQLTYITLAEEFAAWSRNPGHLRFGQHIVNKYLVLGQSAPKIFYEKDAGVAYWLIVEHLDIPSREERK